MTAVIVPFPKHPVRVVRERGGGWLVIWRSCGWLHASRENALADAHAIAKAHNERVIDNNEDMWGGAA